MPVTAKLSRRFYETFGDELTNELVEWFNSMDLTYRADLRELNELNYARFEAKLSEGLANLRAELKQDITTLRSELKQEITVLGSELRQEIAGLRGEVKQDLASHRMGTEASIAQLKVELAVQKADLVRWMFLFWLGTVAVSLASRLL